MTDKETARQNYIQMRQAHVSEKHAADLAMRSWLQSLLAEISGPVMAYRPLASEADPFAGAINTSWLYPRVAGDVMTACSVQSEKDFHQSNFGVWEPSPACAVAGIDDLALILIPGLAFDRQGNRLGFGKGYYDRFLKQTSRRTQRVGIGYSFQVSQQGLPKDEWDERVDWIVTERYVLRTSRV